MKKSTIIIIIIALAALVFVYFKFIKKSPETGYSTMEAETIPLEVIRQSDMFVDGESFKFNGVVYLKTGDSWTVA